jgi:uncharacterized PurR-regulated membrane protein YhhQ (DUF165 family)
VQIDDSEGGSDDEMGGDPGPPTPGHVEHVHQNSYETLYFVLTALFVAMLMLTNIIGTKLFVVSPDLPVLGPVIGWVASIVAALFPDQASRDITLTAGIITYPVTFLITDIVSETFGRKRADRMVWMGFGASLLMLGVLEIARRLRPSPVWQVPDAFAGVFRPDLVTVAADGTMTASSVASQAAYQFTFDAPGTLLLASMTAYLVAQLVDNRLFHFWRRLTHGRALWFRNNMSTVLSQLVDTIIVNGIFLHFYWKMDWQAIVSVIIGVYVLKAFMALLDTPFCYLGVWWAGKMARGRNVG